jgi:hypothetical protein
VAPRELETRRAAPEKHGAHRHARNGETRSCVRTPELRQTLPPHLRQLDSEGGRRARDRSILPARTGDNGILTAGACRRPIGSGRPRSRLPVTPMRTVVSR